MNPPTFSWVGERDAAAYELQWSTSADFTDAATVKSVYTHYEPLQAGRYYWRFGSPGRMAKSPTGAGREISACTWRLLFFRDVQPLKWGNASAH